MSNVVLRARDVSKRYRIGDREQYGALRDILSGWMTAPARYLRSLGQRADRSNAQKRESDTTLWALRDVSFDVEQGEILGVIGRNGAGKSTLLKIVSRITKPTEGSVKLRGRVGSLLEVGTGFHPELTGRENIFLNGAVLGMKRTEIVSKFDEIVAFSEVEKFIDTPVKRYSSGMYMRLAFAVAAHLEPEIMVIDEVLAVGDASFQKKCLGKMGSAAQQGRTVLFVSHNMTAVQDLCHRVIWIDGGKIVDAGDAETVISHYLQEASTSQTELVWNDIAAAPGDEEARLLRVGVRPSGGSSSDPITIHTPTVIEFEYWNARPDVYLHPTFFLYNEQGILICSTGPTYFPNWRERTFPTGVIRNWCNIPGDLLNNGLHRVSVHLAKNDQTLYRKEDALSFDVQDTASKRDGWYGEWKGAIRPMFDWDSEIISENSSDQNLSARVSRNNR
jgi:lipopolysaccharide transport system ATP-binding protein